MSDAEETEEAEDERQEGPRMSPIDGAFGEQDGAPDFDGSPTTPSDGRVRLSDEEEAVLNRIEELETGDPPEPYPHDEPGGTAYVPVGDSMLPYLERRRQDGKGFTVNGKRLYWWVEDSLQPQHPWILLNPTTLANRNYHYNAGICRDFIDADRGEAFVLADSGGFQIVRHEEMEVTDDPNQHDWETALNPERVLEWQVANADAGTILDIPVYRAFEDDKDQPHDGFGSDQFGEWKSEIFDEHLAITSDNADKAIDRWNDIDYDGFDLMGVLHGMPRQDGKGDVLEAYDEWYNTIQDKHDFRGWSLACRYGDRPGLVALLLGYAAENIDAEFLHVLGQGNVWARVLSKLYAQENDAFVTMDGTGFKIGSMFSTMYIPTTYMKSIRMTDRDDENSDTRYEKLGAERMPCGCVVCRQVENQIGGKELFDKPGTERMVLMDLHNLNHLLRRFYLLDSFVAARGRDLLDEVEINRVSDASAPVEIDAKSEFWRILKNWLSKARVAELYYCMDLVVRASDGNLEEAIDDYWFRTPFFEESPGGYKQESAPSIFRDTTSSVYDWE